MSNIFKFPKKYKSQETFFPRNRIFYIGFRYVGPCFCDKLQVLYLKRNGILEGKRWWSMITYAKFEDYNTREYSIELEKCEEDDVPNMLDDFDMGEMVNYKDLRKMGWNGKIENSANILKFENYKN